MENILKRLNITVEEDEFDIDDIDDESELESIEEILGQSKQFTESQSNLIEAQTTYSKLIPKHLDNEIGIPEDAYKERALALINLSIILITSFRIVECKFREPVDETLKVDVFQSLNETGKAWKSMRKFWHGSLLLLVSTPMKLRTSRNSSKKTLEAKKTKSRTTSRTISSLSRMRKHTKKEILKTIYSRYLTLRKV
ncbi:hypothetical protein [Natrinema sp. SYSU A 869]|uniref:hypothetical protein n=1 Tax=Natrinema sp. SYSU A 869 TaxID=2871694 RepID=UPI001CA38F35|nr:hypothetical protein [Natrinema sp. SYSU A 869]